MCDKKLGGEEAVSWRYETEIWNSKLIKLVKFRLPTDHFLAQYCKEIDRCEHAILHI